jgi:DNA-binding transcriptional MerR regulator
MAAAERMANRSHLSIGEVLSLVQEEFPDVTISKIRFLESQGLLDPERTPSGYRKFYDGDIERLQWILTQQRDNFLPLKVIRERLDEWDATGNPPENHRQTPAAGDLPGGGHPPADEADPRHAASSLAASSAVEVMPDPHDRQRRATGAAMEAAPRRSDPAPGGRSGWDDGEPTPVTGEALAGPSANSLTAEELAQRVGLPVPVIEQLESFALIESKRIGPEAYFESSAVPIAEACKTFLHHGVEVRHLRTYKISAEREAGMFEQLVMPLLKQRNPEARTRAVETVQSLAEVGQTLHTALLRNALKDTLS